MSITGVVLSPKIGVRMATSFPEPGAALAASVVALSLPTLLWRQFAGKADIGLTAGRGRRHTSPVRSCANLLSRVVFATRGTADSCRKFVDFRREFPLAAAASGAQNQVTLTFS